MKKAALVSILSVTFLVIGVVGHAQISSQDNLPSNSRLAVIWTSGDPEVASKVCFMYTQNAKRQKWFDDVTLVVWGPSAKLLAGDKDLQAKIKSMAKDGVRIQACQACSDSYGVSNQLREIGIEVRYMGQPLTDMLKQGWKVLTF